MKKQAALLIVAIIIVIIVSGVSINYLHDRNLGLQSGEQFDGNWAYAAVQFQVSLGPRIPGSSAHDQIVVWMQKNLEQYGWSVEI